MKIKQITAICSALLIASCSTNKTNQQVSAEDDKYKMGYECQRVKKTGSMVGKKVCTSRAQREASKEKGQRLLKETRQLQHKDDIN